MKFGYFNPRDYLHKYNYGVVESPDIFIKGTLQFHPKGLFSTEIFGTLQERHFKKGIILFPETIKVLHPEFYDVLRKRARNIYNALRGEIVLEYNPNTKTLEKSDNLQNGLIGPAVIKFIEQHLDEININPTIKDLMLNYREKIWIDSIFVIPPAERDILIENGKILFIHPINNLYSSLIKMVNSIDFDFSEIFDYTADKVLEKTKNLFVWVNLQEQVYNIQQAVRSILSGKQGYIRSVVLGKRLDFTARSVITPNPNLKHYEVGVPYAILAKIFEPFIIHEILVKQPELKNELESILNISLTPQVMRTILTKFRDGRLNETATAIIKKAIESAIEGKVVIIKRDPALHRLSLQAFKPVPVEGAAIQIPPQITPPFNADFDGDTIIGELALYDTVNNEVINLIPG